MTSILPALRQAPSRLTRRFFQCSHRHTPASLGIHSFQIREASLKSARSFNTTPLRSSEGIASSDSSETQSKLSLSSIATGIKEDGRKASAYFFPRTSEKVVAYWLLGSAASVFGLVVFGGLTRLTESGYVDMSSDSQVED